MVNPKNRKIINFIIVISCILGLGLALGSIAYMYWCYGNMTSLYGLEPFMSLEQGKIMKTMLVSGIVLAVCSLLIYELIKEKSK